ncbi:MAG: trigger factor family protein [Barnesiella sp.]
MNVSQQNTDKLNAVISIEVTKADYQESVNKALRTYGQKANIPGFRKGKVPFGILNKMFGKSVLVEEINKLVSDKLFGYIRENQLNILGEPMPRKSEIDFDKQEDFTFNFDIALARK